MVTEKAKIYKSEQDKLSIEKFVNAVNVDFLAQTTRENNRRKSDKQKVLESKIYIVPVGDKNYQIYLVFDDNKAILLTSGEVFGEGVDREDIRQKMYASMAKIAGKGLMYLYKKSEMNPLFI